MSEALPTLEVPEPECPAVLLPTPANLSNMFGDLATLAEKMALAEIEEWKEEGEKIKKILDDVRKLLGPYDPKFKRLEMVEKEWEIMIQRLIEEYPMYIQSQILQLISKIIPINFQLPLLGLEIDLIKLVTDRAYLNELMAEVQGYGADMEAQIAAFREGEWKDLSEEEIQAKIDKLRGDKLEAIYALLPDEYKLFMGEYGFDTADFKGKQIADFIKNEATKLQNALMTGGATLLIDKFKVIWDALGLPTLAGLPLEWNAKELINEAIERAKDESKEELLKALEEIEVAGFNIMDLLGGEFTDNVETLEAKIARIQTKLKEFEANWELFIIKTWLQKVKAFLDAIGLGAILDWALLDFCDFMKLMGIPIPIVDLSTLSGITTTIAGASILPSLSSDNNPSSGYSDITTTAGQTNLGSGDDDTVVVNKNNLEEAFTAYSIDDGEIILDNPAAENDQYIVIPST
mgnify:CR=1 FL=1|tara:strand:+ start:5545 stop:6930 length:1386 start_codon:yes stop_codon:yes gene_type:complete